MTLRCLEKDPREWRWSTVLQPIVFPLASLKSMEQRICIGVQDLHQDASSFFLSLWFKVWGSNLWVPKQLQAPKE